MTVNPVNADSASASISRTSGQAQQQTPNQTPPPLPIGVQAWRAAGFTGAGVKVGIIDISFDGQGDALTVAELSRVRAMCFTSLGNVDDIDIRELTEANRNRENCESSVATNERGSRLDHGTRVARAILDTAPHVTLYISNAPNRKGIRFATDWMQLNAVEVINASLSREWDGPGDGTAEHGHPVDYPMIDPSNVVIAGNALWIAGAGNSARASWFTSDVTFIDNNLQFHPAGTTNPECNMVGLQANKRVEFTLRWQDKWPSDTASAERLNDMEIRVGTIGGSNLTALSPRADEPDSETAAKYPRVVTAFKSGTTTEYCLHVVRTSGTEEQKPRWVQIQRRDDDGVMSTGASSHSIDNPAESTNVGLLAVGATSRTRTGIWRDSGRGPLPASDTIKPDLVAIGTSILSNAEETGTSYAAPRVAGMAAPVRPALRDNPLFDEAEELANYLRRYAEIPTNARFQNNEMDPAKSGWGHGLAQLPPAATTPWLYRDPNNRRKTDIVLVADPTNPYPDIFRPITIAYEFVLDGSDPPEITQHGFYSRRGEIDIHDLRQGVSHRGRVKTCTDHYATMCGDWSEYSEPEFLPVGVDTPRMVRTIPGDGIVTLRWQEELSATNYQVDFPAENKILHAEKNGLTIDENLTNGVSYQFRVRARRETDTAGQYEVSAWSDFVTGTPREVLIEKPVIHSIQAWPRALIFLQWAEVANAAAYEIQQWDGVNEKGKWIVPGRGGGQPGQRRVIPGPQRPDPTP